MKSTWIRSFVGLALAAVSAVGCSSGSPQKAEETSEGVLDLSLYEFQNEQDRKNFPSVDYTITCPGFTKSGSFSSSNIHHVHGVITGIPTGPGCEAALSTKSTDGSWTCAGKSRTFKEKCTDNDQDDEIRVLMVCTHKTVRSWHRTAVIGRLNLVCKAPDAGTDAGQDVKVDGDAKIDSEAGNDADACKPATQCPAGQTCGTAPNGCGGTITCGTCTGTDVCDSMNHCTCPKLTACPAGKVCGSISDNCGGTVTCGVCPSGQSCDQATNTCKCQPTTCAASNATCGQLADGCGGTLNCGTCTAPNTCDTATHSCKCQPTTCVAKGLNCGSTSDGCGATLNCGTCTGAGQTCGGGPGGAGTGTPGVCGGPTCATTCPAGQNCGTAPNGCGGTITCGTCTAPQTCNTTVNRCECVPTVTCASAGRVCGPLADGCGTTLDCGICTGVGQTCNSNGMCECTPKTPAQACTGGQNCGTAPDGCGGTVNCGACPAPQTCGANNQCTCIPATTCPAGQDCGSAPDGCNGTISCGTCTAPQTCGGGGTANKCGSPTCAPNCSGKNCGDDGCGGSCGTCTAPDTCGGSGTPGVCGRNVCGDNNAGAPCSATEQKFVNKSPECYSCMVNAGCLDDAIFGDTGRECEDVPGNAAKGDKTGTPRTQLCLDLIDCIINPANLCASTNVQDCYCGSLKGNACQSAAPGAPDGKCLHQELDGLEHLISEAPSVVLPDYTSSLRGGGQANQLFVCAKSNGCDALCSQ